MPLGAVQLLLLLLALASLPLLLGWQRDLTLLWPTYHAGMCVCVCVFVLLSSPFGGSE